MCLPACLLFLVLARLASADNRTFHYPSFQASSSSRASTSTASLASTQASAGTFPVSRARTRTAIINHDVVTTRQTVNTNSTVDFATLMPTLPATEIASVSSIWQCLQALTKYDEDVFYTRIGTTLGYTNTSLVGRTYTVEATSYLNNYTFTECDGAPRIGYSGGTPSSTIYDVASVLTSDGWTTAPVVSFPPPPCSVDESTVSEYCPQLMTVYNRYESLYRSYEAEGTIVEEFGFDWPSTCVQLETASACDFQIGTAQLWYWPVSTTGGGMCDKAGRTTLTATPTGNGPNVATISGVTLTSPTVYVSYGEIEYYSFSGDYFTLWTSDRLILPFQSEEVSTVCGLWGEKGTFPVDYADLDGKHVPATAYSCQPMCYYPEFCSTIDTELYPYNPHLAWPTTFLDILASLNNLDPDQCTFNDGNGGIFDPPRTLIPAQGLLAPKPNDPGPTTRTTPVTAEPASPSVPLPNPAVTTSLATSARPRIVQEDPGTGNVPDVGGAIVSMINQPPGAPLPGFNEVDQQDPGDAVRARARQTGQAVISVRGTPAMTVAKQTNNAQVVQGTTFWAGDRAFIRGQSLSFGIDSVVVNGRDTVSYKPIPPLPTITAPPAIAVGGTPLLLGGAAATVNGQVVSYGPQGLVIGGTRTVAISADTKTSVYIAGAAVDLRTTPAVISVGGFLLFSGGAPVVINGESVSYGPWGIVIGGRHTEALPAGSGGSIMIGGKAVSVGVVTDFPVSRINSIIADAVRASKALASQASQSGQGSGESRPGRTQATSGTRGSPQAFTGAALPRRARVLPVFAVLIGLLGMHV